MKPDIIKHARGRLPFLSGGQTVYEWEQTLDEIHVYIVLPLGVRKSDLEISFRPKIYVGIKTNPPYLSCLPAGVINSEESLWVIEDNELHLIIHKGRKGETWKSAFEGHGTVNPLVLDETKKKLMLERFQQDHPGFDFSDAEFTGTAPDPRNFMGGI